MPAVAAAVKQLHSYDLPEVLAVDATGGSEAYLNWVRTSTVARSSEAPNVDTTSSAAKTKDSVCEAGAVKLALVTGEVVDTQSAHQVMQESLVYDAKEGTAETGAV